MPLPVFVVDEDVNVLECNAAATRLFGNPAGNKQRRRRRCIALPACDGNAERMRWRTGLSRLRVARGGARSFPGPSRVTRQWAEMELMSGRAGPPR